MPHALLDLLTPALATLGGGTASAGTALEVAVIAAAAGLGVAALPWTAREHREVAVALSTGRQLAAAVLSTAVLATTARSARGRRPAARRVAVPVIAG